MSRKKQSVAAMRLEHRVKEFVMTFEKEAARLSQEELMLFAPVAKGALGVLICAYWIAKDGGE